MARTYNDIYYNDDENSTAEILDDMKKLAESVDQQIGSIKSFNNDTSQFIEQVTPLMNNLSEQVIDMHQLADTMFTELEQVKEENKQLRQDLNGLPKGQASGESIDLNDSAEMRCELKISGNSKQETRSGKNLIRNENINVGDDCYWSSYSTFDKETYTMTRKTTNTTESFITYRIGNGIIKNNTQYTISFEAKKNDYVKSFEVLFIGYNASGIRSKTIDLTKKFQKYTYTFTTDATADYKSLSQIRFDNNGSTESGKEAILTIKNVMLVEGTDTDFEQYGVSPSPDYPSEVKSCGDNINIFDGEVEEGNIDASTGQNTAVTTAWRSKNYLNVKDTSVSISVKDLTFSGTVGRLYFYKSDNTYISNILINSLPFTATLPNKTAKVRFFILNSVADINAKIKLEKGSTVTPYSPYGQGCINEVICNDNLFDKNNLIPYTVIPRSNGVAITNNSSNYEPYNATDFIPVKENTNYFINFTFASTNYGWCFYDKNKNFISGIEPNVKSFATPKETAYLRFCYDKNRIDTNTIQLVEGSTEKPYVEHKEQIYTIPTQQPFRAIDNIRDTFIKKNNKWYERHYEVEIIVDGTETINKSSSKEFFAISKTTSNIDTSANAVNVSKSNYGTGTTLGLGEGNTNNKYSFNASTIYLDCYGSNINTVDKLKAQLAETPMKIYALLKEPLDIECTEEQSTILFDIEQNAKTYDKVTHMYSTDNVSPVIDVTYKKDIETLFANTLVEGV